jgi:hypothetical protein
MHRSVSAALVLAIFSLPLVAEADIVINKQTQTQTARCFGAPIQREFQKASVATPNT